MNNKDLNIPQFVQNWAKETPDAEALQVLARRPYSLTYRQLDERVWAMAQRLVELGVKPGDRVAILSNLDERCIVTLLAVASLRGVGVPINMESPASEHVLQAYGQSYPFTTVCHTNRFNAFIRRVFQNSKCKYLPIDSVKPALQPARTDMDGWRERIDRVLPNDIFYLNFTSGSTSNPKLVEATHGQLIANARDCIEFFRVTNQTRQLCLFSYHLHEHLVRPFLVGACAIVQPHNPVGTSLAEACKISRASHLICNPHLVMSMAAEPADKLQQLQGQLNVIEVGGGLISPQFGQSLEKTTGAKFLPCYGATELGGEALVTDWNDHDLRGRFRPLPSYTIRIANEEGGDVEAGIGDLIIAGPAIAKSYVVSPPGETQLSHYGFHTKDLAALDDDGRVRVFGRCDHAVKMLGSRQPVEPIEQTLKNSLAQLAKDVQVLDIETQGFARFLGFGNSLVVIVVPGDYEIGARGGRQIARAIKRARLESFLTAPAYYVIAEPDEVAKTDTGKLRRGHARSRFPYLLSEWDDSRKKRLIPLAPTVGGIARGARRLVVEAGRIASPARIFSSLATRAIRSVLPKRTRRWNTVSKWFRRTLLTLVLLYLVFIVVLMALEDRFVFQRSGRGGRFQIEQPDVAHEDVWITTSDDIRLHGIFCPNPRPTDDAGSVVLYCHGNKGTIERKLQVASDWQQALGCSVLLFDYRGYGRSEGTPSEEGVYRDSHAAYKWLVETKRFAADDIIIVGRSLGAAIALELATTVEHRALVLESTFTSLPDLATDKIPLVPAHLLMRNRFPSEDRIRDHHGPIVIAHGVDDDAIPPTHGKRLFEAANKPKLFYAIPTKMHMDLPTRDYYKAVREFLMAPAYP